MYRWKRTDDTNKDCIMYRRDGSLTIYGYIAIVVIFIIEYKLFFG